jgi:hypothetical protein
MEMLVFFKPPVLPLMFKKERRRAKMLGNSPYFFLRKMDKVELSTPEIKFFE